MNRRIVALMLCLAVLAACACAETAGMKVYQLGTSPFTIEIPASFVEGERTEEDIRDDMVAYLHSPETLLDFDVYQFDKEGYPDILADFAAQEAEEYQAAETVTDGEINGIAAAWYRAVEQYDGQEYPTLTYILEDGDQYVEIVFWLDGDAAEEEAQAIIGTLATVNAAMANPWVESSNEEIAEAIGAAFGIPDGSGDISYSLMPDDGLAEMRFTLDGMDYVARIMPAGEFTDISGMYCEWDVEDDFGFAGMETLTQRAFTEDATIDLCQWYDRDMGLMYSLTTSGEDLDGFDITAVAAAIYAQAEEAE